MGETCLYSAVFFGGEVISLATCPRCSGRSRFLSTGYDRVVPVTHQDQAVDRCSGAGLAVTLPQRNVGAAEVARKGSQRGGSRAARPIPNWLTRRTTRCTTTQAVAIDLHSDPLVHPQTPWLADRPSP